MKGSEIIAKLLLGLLKSLVMYVFSVGFVALGWNCCLTKVFEAVPVLSFEKLLLLTLALTFIASPVTANLYVNIKDLIKGN